MTTNKTQSPPEPEVLDAEPVDERTGAPIQRGIQKAIAQAEPMPTTEIQVHTFELTKMGTIKLSPEETAILNETLDPNDVLIRPNDGLVYLPWTWYTRRLNKALGLLQWALPPNGLPIIKPKGDTSEICWPHWLVIRGVVIGMAMGDATYVASNKKMSYSDAAESAKSNALSRNCKILGMALELWDKDWADGWRAKYAYKGQDDSGKVVWLKNKDAKQPEDPEEMAARKSFVEELISSKLFKDAKEIGAFMKQHKLKYCQGMHQELRDKIVEIQEKREKI